jgi:hypothetical protein
MAGRKLGFRRPDEEAAQPPVSPRKLSAPSATTTGGGRPSAGETPVVSEWREEARVLGSLVG